MGLWEERFGEVRALLQEEALGVFERRTLWGHLTHAFKENPGAYAQEWVPYLAGFTHHWSTPLAVVESMDEAQRIAPFARFERSLVPRLKESLSILEAHAHHIEKTLRPPLPDDAIAKLLKEYGADVEPRLLDLYSFCDGFELTWSHDDNVLPAEHPAYDPYLAFLRKFSLYELEKSLSLATESITPLMVEAMAEEMEESLDLNDYGELQALYQAPLEDMLHASLRFLGHSESSGNASSGTYYDDGVFEQAADEGAYASAHAYEAMAGYVHLYFGSLRHEGKQFVLERRVIDDEIVGVMCTETAKRASSDVLSDYFEQFFHCERHSSCAPGFLHAYLE